MPHHAPPLYVMRAATQETALQQCQGWPPTGLKACSRLTTPLTRTLCHTGLIKEYFVYSLQNDLWVWNFEVGQWSQVWTGSGGRNVPKERCGHSASLVGYGHTRAMLIVGGQQAQGNVSAETWTYNFGNFFSRIC
jgi:hypothetical protein